MTFDFVRVLDFLGIDNVWFFALVVLIVWFLFFPDRFDRVRTVFLRLFGFLGSQVRRRYHRSAIVSALNPQIEAMRRELGLKDELPKLDVRYASARGQERPTFDDGRVIIYLRDAHKHRTENVTRAAMDYVNASVYPLSRPYMNEVTNQALDMALTRRLLRDNKDAFSYFTRYFVDDECKANEDLRKVYESLLLVDERGFLASILLHQLALMTTRLYPLSQHDAAVQSEVVGFVRWIANIAARERGEHFHPRFEVDYIRVGLILLGRDETLEAGFGPYLRVASQMAMSSLHGFYVLAAGRKAPLVNKFVEHMEINGYMRRRMAHVSVKHLTLPDRPGLSDQIAVGYVQLTRAVAGDAVDSQAQADWGTPLADAPANANTDL